MFGALGAACVKVMLITPPPVSVLGALLFVQLMLFVGAVAPWVKPSPHTMVVGEEDENAE